MPRLSAVTGASVAAANTWSSRQTFNDIEIDGALDHDGTTVGFYGVTPAARPTVGAATAGIVYGTTEQGMIQRVYDMARTLGLGT